MIRPLLCALALVVLPAATHACASSGRSPGADSDSADVAEPDTAPPADTTPAPDLTGSDDILGASVPRAESWWTAGGRLYRGGNEVVLRGINWFGLETPDRALHGLWSGRSVDQVLGQLGELGFNALRIPVSPETLEGLPAAPWARAEGGTTARAQLDHALERAGAAGFFVLLDLHTCDPDVGGGQAAAPDSCDGYTIADWHADLEALALLAKDHPHVLGVDLFNEPHGLTWSAWRDLATAAGRVVLAVNPRVLLFVEGVGNASDTGGDYAFWGENLHEAAALPPDLPASRLVFSPHVYGPGVNAQPYFSAPDFPTNLPAIWDAHFGHLREAGYAVVPGELGGWYDDGVAPGEVAWNEALVAYLAAWQRPSFFYWAVNPNSGDTGGIFEDDWETVVQRKVSLLQPLLAR